MIIKDFRTYRRRSVTRRSGYKASGEKTGGECILLTSDAYITQNETEEFNFFHKNIELIELFENNLGIIAFGGYLFSEKPFKITFSMNYIYGGKPLSTKYALKKNLNSGDWNCIGFHKEFSFDIGGRTLSDIYLKLTIETEIGSLLQFVGFDFNKINFHYFLIPEAQTFFNQKTMMHVPHIYYLESLFPIEKYLLNEDNKNIFPGDVVVFKSCNRCTRYIPINISNEPNTLGFSLHCVKKAPCTHSLFCSYSIDNIKDIDKNILKNNFIKDKKVNSHYGHQLECRACKKFFVNAPLNPKRNSQQFREDALRRRATEALVNNLLERDLIHHEFLKKTKREFSEYIWNNFGRKCFKCNEQLELDEMHLDHTMPLAYLYRLDETATCLCSVHNSQKRDRFPIDYYTKQQLISLSKITGLDINILKTKKVNEVVLKLLIKNVTWFFDDFLANPDYQKIRDDRLTSDKIYASLVRVIGNKIDLVAEYYKLNNTYPNTISIQRSLKK